MMRKERKKTESMIAKKLESTKKNKRPSTWGKAESGGAIAGTPPAVFIHNLRKNVSAKNVTDELLKRGVKVSNVTLKAHEEAWKASFLVEVEDRASYDLLMSGDVTPSDVGVRQWRAKRVKKNEQNQGAAWPASGNQSSL